MNKYIKQVIYNDDRLNPATNKKPINWQSLFSDAGYTSVFAPNSFKDYHRWNSLLTWCNEHIGEDNFTWINSTFWFESDRDAMQFALRWT